MRRILSHPVSLVFCFVLLCLFSRISIAADTLTPIQPIRDGQTLVSSNEIFELGFFSPGNSKNRYFGMWYKNISVQTVVWVANRENPIADSEGVLKIGNDGNLTLINGSGSVFWSSNSSQTNNAVAQLLDTGNLVVKDGNDNKSGSFLWQSFDYPTDTLLPGMKLGLNLKTGLNRFLTSWKNARDPSPGQFSLKVDPNGAPQLFLWNGLVQSYRSGPWNELQLTGVPKMRPDFIFIYEFISNEEEVYYSYKLIQNSSAISRLVLNHSGEIQRFTLIDQSRDWRLLWSSPKDQCDNYEECGPYGFCNIDDSPICQCAHGFEPRSPQNWQLRDGSGGCVRKTSLDCQKGDGFYKLTGMKLPDTSHSLVNKSKSLKECEDACLKNCSCMAYASANVTGEGSGCVIWDRDLMDLKQYTSEGGQDLFIRLASSELEAGGSSKGSTGTKKRVVAIVTVTVVVVVLLLIGIFIWKRKAKKSIWTRKSNERGGTAEVDPSGEISNEEELPFFDLHTIQAATENFSTENKIGEGGFGPVYKGKLMEGKEIAVKRLSKCSGQGLDEFKNEVISIAKLQHRNLIRLLGYCIQGEEKLLIYEYMQNKSLDFYIFGKTTVLDWQQRFQIIAGIARGLLYLHQDSRFRIIHRDLKAGNILLDSEMNPKISDFGMARIFGGDQTQAKTKRVVGTYGYMSPEYALEGLFSVKSDVFSFGVLVLEIVSGRKNRGFTHSDHDLNLLGHAWNLWKEGKGSELIDASMSVASYPISEVLRCIHVGLLCVQKLTNDRPTMSSVVLMLGSESVKLPEPKQPGFFIERSLLETDPGSSMRETSCSINNVTITTLEAR